ncbi:MAG: oligosaccharide repeat unit polymerase [Bacteroidales bacterium]|nr:oligosaccharide repeat unit polymerase [Bacteroidales bacterium]
MNTSLGEFNTDITLSGRFKFFIALFVFLFVFSTYKAFIYSNPLAITFYDLFQEGIFNPAFFSIFQIFVVTISFYLIIKYNHGLAYSSVSEKLLYFSSYLYVALILLNPNNHSKNPILGLPLFSDISNYIYILFMYSIFFIKETKVVISILRWFFHFFVIFMLMRLLVALIMFFLGYSTPIELHSSVLEEDDTLLFTAFLQIFFLFKFYVERKKKFVILSILLFFFIILSFRRGSTFIALITSTILYLTTIFQKRRFLLFFGIIFMFVILAIYGQDILSFLLPDSLKIYFYRLFGAFVSVNIGDVPAQHIIQNQHLEQSSWAVKMAFDKLGFWGSGYGSIPDQFRWKNVMGIHNSYVDLWMKFGLYAVIYYLFWIILLLKELMVTFSYRREKEFFLFRIFIITFLVLFYAQQVSIGSAYLIQIKMLVFQIIMFTLLFKVKPSNYKWLLHSIIHIRIK